MKIKIGKFLIREKPKHMWIGRGIFWMSNIILITLCWIFGLALNNIMFIRVASLLVFEYFIGDLLIYHKLEKVK